MSGQTAVVVEDVDNEGLTGRVETDNRMTWAARSADGSFIPQGASCASWGRRA